MKTKEAKTQRTPGEWRLLEPDQIRGPQGEFIADCHCGFMRGFDRGNAVFIVRACNAHDDLVAACETYMKLWKEVLAEDFKGSPLEDLAKMTRAAIAKARREV